MSNSNEDQNSWTFDKIEDLARVLTSGRVRYCVFLGAGASVPAVPIASEMIEIILEKLFREVVPAKRVERFLEVYGEELPEKNVTLECVLYALKLRHGDIDKGFIMELINGEKRPPEGIKALAMLVYERIFDVIFTVNFDELLEKAFKDFVKVIPKTCETDFLRYLRIDRLPLETVKRPLVFKLHGTYTEPDTMVGSWEETRRLPKGKSKVLTNFLEDHGFIFVGYSANDYDIRGVLESTSHSGPFIYWVSPHELSCNTRNVLGKLNKDVGVREKALPEFHIRQSSDDFFWKLLDLVHHKVGYDTELVTQLTKDAEEKSNALAAEIAKTLDNLLFKRGLTDTGRLDAYTGLFLSVLYAFGETTETDLKLCREAAHRILRDQESLERLEEINPRVKIETMAYNLLSLGTVRELSKFDKFFEYKSLAKTHTKSLSDAVQKFVEKPSDNNIGLPVSVSLFALVESDYADRQIIEKLVSIVDNLIQDEGVSNLLGEASTFATATALMAGSRYATKLSSPKPGFIARAIYFLRGMHVPNEGFRETMKEKESIITATTMTIMALLFAGEKPDNPLIVEAVKWLLKLSKENKLSQSFHPSLPRTRIVEPNFYAKAHTLFALRLWLIALREKSLDRVSVCARIRPVFKFSTRDLIK